MSLKQRALGTSFFVGVWERSLEERMSFVTRWDKEIEAGADYRPKGKVFPEQVWQAIANIEKITPQNVRHVLYARQLIARLKEEDFQHIF